MTTGRTARWITISADRARSDVTASGERGVAAASDADFTNSRLVIMVVAPSMRSAVGCVLSVILCRSEPFDSQRSLRARPAPKSGGPRALAAPVETVDAVAHVRQP